MRFFIDDGSQVMMPIWVQQQPVIFKPSEHFLVSRLFYGSCILTHVPIYLLKIHGVSGPFNAYSLSLSPNVNLVPTSMKQSKFPCLFVYLYIILNQYVQYK